MRYIVRIKRLSVISVNNRLTVLNKRKSSCFQINSTRNPNKCASCVRQKVRDGKHRAAAVSWCRIRFY